MRKTVLVTGASRGIGKTIAIRFAKEGYHVIINCLKNKEQLLQTKKEIESFGVSCIAYVGNIGDEKCATEMFSVIQNEFGSIDVLINNAGISYIGLLTDMSMDEWNYIIQSNLNSVFLCSKLAIPGMVHNKNGRIINISSVWGVVGASCEVAYSATKGAINAFTMALAKELAPSNIQVNAVACGAIDTEMNQFLEEEERGQLIQEIPSERFGQTSEVADFLYQLATGSSYLTGQVIKFDGAWL
ncbi:MAG TPA: SDR family NAD(P)-dependent oxidoreductase [Lachnospiraceae bacterium]|nr:SDR family NAD(P)-dependent oxidoreductase [Lachnospiraceae bacterium]